MDVIYSSSGGARQMLELLCKENEYNILQIIFSLQSRSSISLELIDLDFLQYQANAGIALQTKPYYRSVNLWKLSSFFVISWKKEVIKAVKFYFCNSNKWDLKEFLTTLLSVIEIKCKLVVMKKIVYVCRGTMIWSFTALSTIFWLMW